MILPVLALILPAAGRANVLLVVPYAVLRHVSSPTSQLQQKQHEHYQIVPIAFTCPHGAFCQPSGARQSLRSRGRECRAVLAASPSSGAHLLSLGRLLLPVEEDYNGQVIPS